MQIGQRVQTFTKRRGVVAGALYAKGQCTPYRIKVRIDLQIEDGPMLATLVYYRPGDVAALTTND